MPRRGTKTEADGASARADAPLALASAPCVACGAPIAGRFCAACGELRGDLRRGGIGQVLLEIVESLTSLDGRFLGTLRALITRPGELTAAYLRGVRKRFLGPVQTFVIANVVYFAMQTWLGWNALSSPLHAHIHQMPYSRLARAHLIAFADKRFGLDVTKEQDFAVVARAFNALVPTHAKSLVAALVPLYALGVALVLARRRVGALGVVVFSAHTMSALLWVWGLAFLPLAQLCDDATMSVLILSALGLYQWFALRRAFGISAGAAAACSVALVASFGVALFVYRLLLFVTVLHTLELPRS